MENTESEFITPTVIQNKEYSPKPITKERKRPLNFTELKTGAEVQLALTRATLKEARENPKAAIDRALTASHRSRLKTENENRQRKWYQKLLRKGPIGWTIRTAIEAISIPIIGYGPGDFLTAADAIFGQNFLTGDKLDIVDRFAYVLASVVPYVPSTLTLPIVNHFRRRIEENHISRKQDDQKTTIGVAKDVLRTTQPIE